MKVSQMLFALCVGAFTFVLTPVSFAVNGPEKPKAVVRVTPEQKAAFEAKKAAAMARKKATLQARRGGNVPIQTATGGCVGGKAEITGNEIKH